MYKKIQKMIVIFSILFVTIFLGKYHTYALTPASNEIYDGIDVSDWQGYINYSEVKNSGIQIVYIKASQGTSIKDPYFDINYENAKANGLKVGFYHFLEATNTEEAKQEANFFASVIHFFIYSLVSVFKLNILLNKFAENIILFLSLSIIPILCKCRRFNGYRLFENLHIPFKRRN